MEFNEFIPDAERPVIVSKEEKAYIRDGKLENAFRAFRRPPYPKMSGRRKASEERIE